jgi:rare lipoprotein A
MKATQHIGFRGRFAMGRSGLWVAVVWGVLVVLGGCAPKKPLESGKASWYGPGFAWNKTASGDRFFPNLRRTAAHKTLPFGTVLLVVRSDTGESVRVVVNDRGPHRADRVIDLSRKAARRLNMVKKGVAPVNLVVVGCRDRYRKTTSKACVDD